MKSSIASKNNSNSTLINQLHSSSASSQSGFFTTRENGLNRKGNIYYWYCINCQLVFDSIESSVSMSKIIIIYPFHDYGGSTRQVLPWRPAPEELCLPSSVAASTPATAWSGSRYGTTAFRTWSQTPRILLLPRARKLLLRTVTLLEEQWQLPVGWGRFYCLFCGWSWNPKRGVWCCLAVGVHVGEEETDDCEL